MIKLPFDIKSIKPGEFIYFTKRKLENNAGEELGEIYVWKRKGDDEHSYIMSCPHCSNEGTGNVDLQRRPYRVRCENCQKSIVLKKLKDL